jgi:hypothetical protein
MPNPSIPAAGGAMPAQGHATRRLFLAAGSVAAVFATVKKAAALPAGADAELMALTDAIARADKAEAIASDAHTIPEKAFFDARPTAPTAPAIDISSEDWFKAMQDKLASDEAGDAGRAQAAEYEKALAEHKQAIERLRVDSGLAAAWERIEEAQAVSGAHPGQDRRNPGDHAGRPHLQGALRGRAR